MTLFSFLASALLTAAYVLLIWWVDRYEREPLKLLAIAFLWGALPAVLASALFESALGRLWAALFEDYADLISSSLVAPPVEEVLKGLAVWAIYRLARYEFDGVLDGIVYGSLVGFGFAMTENALYFWSAQAKGDLGHWAAVVVGRGVAFGLNHALFTSLTGIGLGVMRYWKHRGTKILVALLGLGAAMLAHALHNAFAASDLCLVSLMLDWAGVLVVLGVILLAWQRERAWMQTHLIEEVEAGLLTKAELDLIASRGRRYREAIRALGKSGNLKRVRLWQAFANTAAELAFKKHQLATMGEESGNSVYIARLRERLEALRAQLAPQETACEGG